MGIRVTEAGVKLCERFVSRFSQAGILMRSNHRITRKQIIAAVLSIFLLSDIWIQAAQAQSQDNRQQEIQQLKDKLDQLDQMMTEVKGELSALEATAPHPPKATAVIQSPAKAKEAPAQQVAVPSGAVTVTAQAGTVPLEGEITEAKDTVNFYGFAMLDSGYDFGQVDPNWYDVVRPTKLPAYHNQFAPSGNVYAGVRQTRFGVKSSTPTPLGDLKTVFEFELFGTGVDAGQTTFRLRHAYGELGQFGAGQTWSPFMDIGVFPNTVEYWGPNGMVFFRNIQVRWMPIRSDRGSVTIALEKPGGSGDQGIYADRIELSNIKPRFNWPDLSGNGRIDRDWGYIQMAAIVRKIGWVDTSKNTTNLGGSVVGWGINLTSNLNLSKATVAKLAFTYGHGTENYMNDAPVDVGIEHTSSGSIVPIKGVALPVLGFVAFLDHTWSERFTSSAGYSMVNIDNSNAQLPSDFHQGDYSVANLLYHPIPRVTIGPEFQFGRRVNFSDGFSSNDYRLQFSFKFDWEKSFKSPTF
jgi:cell division protein FtsB